MSYKWQTDGSISWKDGDAGVVPELPLSEDGGDWTDAYAAFGPSGSSTWSLFGIINEMVAYISSLPSGRYWLNPVLDSTLLSPISLTPSDGDRYLINGAGDDGWTGHDNCIAQYDGGLADWVYYEAGGAGIYGIGDGASTWDATHDTYWVFNIVDPGPPAVAEWIQCGGTTLEKEVVVTALGDYNIDAMTERGATFIGNQTGGTTTFVLPACDVGLYFKFMKNTAIKSTYYVEISVLDGEAKNILLQQRALILDADGTPVYPEQAYRKIRLVSKNDNIALLGTKEGWVVVGGNCTFQDISPQHAGTAQGSSGVNSITLQAAGTSIKDYEYAGRLIYITACSGVPTAVGQIRMITDYHGSIKEAIVDPAWTGTAPDNTATYEMVRYDAVNVGMGEMGSIYSNPYMDAYDPTGAAFSKSGFPTISRYAGLNMTDTWGALLLGRHQHAEAGAKFATAFGEYTHARWDNQMVFGNLPVQNHSGAYVPGMCQASRIVLGAYVGTAKDLSLGTGHGETSFVAQVGRAYYVTYSVMASVYGGTPTQPHIISWSGSFVATFNPGTNTLAILSGSDNQVETANLNVLAGALTLEIDVSANAMRFKAANTYPNRSAQFVGFADVIEMEYLDQVS